jgi:hypothetical protein
MTQRLRHACVLRGTALIGHLRSPWILDGPIIAQIELSGDPNLAVAKDIRPSERNFQGNMTKFHFSIAHMTQRYCRRGCGSLRLELRGWGNLRGTRAQHWD